MFPPTYFAPTLFTPSYFAEAGSGSPTAPLVIAGWSCVVLDDDADGFGTDPEQTQVVN